MALTPARTPPGLLELLPLEQIAFQRMLDTVRRNYERFGFLPVETPVFEHADVLLTKQGGETERQVYFVQSSGNLEKGDRPDLALRFDLTVPLARYVAEHEAQLSFPFRRYQMQRVYRGERNQRGRFREFYQCDVDVIGKDSLSVRYDAELPAIIYNLFRDLGVGPFVIHLNNRRLMRGFLERLGVPAEAQPLVLREVDKLDKRGPEHVRQALSASGFGLTPDSLDRLFDFVRVRSTSLAHALQALDELDRGLGPTTPDFETGRAELKEVLGLIKAFGVPEPYFALNLSIARGLDYYTGTVYETILTDHPDIGSVCSGGRYDDLAGHYTKSKLPGVGISIGATRLYWQLREAGIAPAAESTVAALVTNMDAARLPDYLELAGGLRAAGLNVEVVMEPGKLAKQFKYADRAGVRFVLVLGPDELEKGTVTVKDLRAQSQDVRPRASLAEALVARLAPPAAAGA
ncbi:MAG TPA: histidine--tRNA ligase [Polyangiaceae bacterium]|nr:histidine--tRNA ligase [Polyangiaceae bacterium]